MTGDKKSQKPQDAPMKKTVTPSLSAMATGALSVPAITAALLFCAPPSEAHACGGSPPPQCGVSVSCTLASGDTLSTDGSAAVGVAIPAAYNVVITGNDPRCPGQRASHKTTVTATCTSLDGSGMGGGGGTAMIDSMSPVLASGPNDVLLPLQLGKGGARTCDVDANVTIALTSGQSAQTSCSTDCLLTVQDPSAMNKPLLEITMANQAEWLKKVSAGNPAELKYRVTNHGTTDFDGRFAVSSSNPVKPVTTGPLPPRMPDPATAPQCKTPTPPTGTIAACQALPAKPVCGCDDVIYANECLMKAQGVTKLSDTPTDCTPPLPAGGFYIIKPGQKNDNLPVGIDIKNFDPCTDLDVSTLTPGNNPPVSDSFTFDKAIKPGETREVSVYIRAAVACPTCSTAQVAVSVIGNFGDGSSGRACGATAVSVDTSLSIPQLVCPETDGDTPPVDPGPAPGTTPSGSPDTDGDGSSDWDEERVGSDPMIPDTDGDGVTDGEELDKGTNPTLKDSDEDGLHDDVDPDPLNDDADGDGLPDGMDQQPLNPDVDGDGLLDGAPDPDLTTPDADGDGFYDGVEVGLGFDPDDATSKPAFPPTDTDSDGLPDVLEAMLGSDPTKADSDGDGLVDIREYLYKSDPTKADTDGDGLTDLAEVTGPPRSNPVLADTDGDGLRDNDEKALGTNPNLRDSDFDGLTDFAEVHTHRTNPLNADSDKDGIRDGLEISGGYDPLLADAEKQVGMHAARAGLTFTHADPTKSLRIVRQNTLVQGIKVLGQRASSTSLSERVGRIEEIIEIAATSSASTPITIKALYAPTLAAPESTLRVNETIFSQKPGPKEEAPQDAGKDVYAGGSVRINSAPYLVYDLAFQGSVWTPGPGGLLEQLKVTTGLIQRDMATGQMEVNLTVTPPAGTSLLYLMSDINGFARQDFESECGDGADNDGDGQIDTQDDDCPQSATNPVERCGDGIDNDGNGQTDCADLMCANNVVCSATTAEVCDDQVDNDGNGQVDCADAACASFPVCQSTGGGSARGDGGCHSIPDGGQAPLAPLALLGLGWVTLRRQRRSKKRA